MATEGSSSSGAAPKRRRLSAAAAGRVESALGQLKAEAQERQLKSDIEEIVTEMRENPDIVLSVKAFVFAGAKLNFRQGKFPRGVRMLAEGSGKIPQRDAYNLVAKSFKISPSAIANIDNVRDNIYRIMQFGLNLPGDFKLPTKLKSVVCQWMEDQYIAQGSKLKDLTLDDGPLQWESGEIGAYKLIEEDGMAASVQHRASGEIQGLRETKPIDNWTIKQNWSERAATLVCDNDGYEITVALGKLFHIQPATVADWKIPESDSDNDEGEQQVTPKKAAERTSRAAAKSSPKAPPAKAPPTTKASGGTAAKAPAKAAAGGQGKAPPPPPGSGF